MDSPLSVDNNQDQDSNTESSGCLNNSEQQGTKLEIPSKYSHNTNTFIIKKQTNKQKHDQPKKKTKIHLNSVPSSNC